MLPAKVLHFNAGVGLFEDADNLLFTEARFLHQSLLSVYSAQKTLLLKCSQTGEAYAYLSALILPQTVLYDIRRRAKALSINKKIAAPAQ
jgi:hypothetical protein